MIGPKARRITEGVAGYWHYHLSEADNFTRGLCGAPTMTTSMKLSHWRKKFGEHFPKRPTWCDKCEAIHKGAPSPEEVGE